ncbi:MAG: effector-associated constant component EACC1 [Pseudonocardiaceae bacterium]
MAAGSDLLVQVNPADDGDDEETAGLARRLRAELLDLDVDTVEPVPGGMAPEGAKGLSSLAGTLAVRWGAAGLRAVLTTIRDWVSRNGRTVELTIDGDTLKVTRATSEQQEQIINTWLARHAAGP